MRLIRLAAVTVLAAAATLGVTRLAAEPSSRVGVPLPMTGRAP